MSIAEPHVNHIVTVEKRDGRIEDFDASKIRGAIRRAMVALDEDKTVTTTQLDYLTEHVLNNLADQDLYEPTVEEIQDAVENVLIREGEIGRAHV